MENTEKKIIESQIEALNSLDSRLQEKAETLRKMSKEDNLDRRLLEKSLGVGLAREEIRRDIKDLQERLKEIEI
jgi:hypothetical protein